MREHKRKTALARRILTRIEIKNHTPIFQSKAWMERAEIRKIKVNNRIVEAQYQKEARKSKLKVDDVKNE
jgi:hypothetical protein